MDVVIVGYLGVLDIHLARWCWPRATLVLDHLAPAAGTVGDRSGGRWAARLAAAVDDWAVRRADVVVVDTDEHRDAVDGAEVVTVPVGAPTAWFHEPQPRGDGPLRVVFFGLHTPLQGTPTVGRAIRLALDAGADLQATMVGSGQDLPACRAELQGHDAVVWHPWIASTDLIRLVASHDVCLGIFGTTPKAARVVPNKAFQGAAAGCVVVTSDTAPQRRLLGAVGVYVPAGDAEELAKILQALASDPERVARSRRATFAWADVAFRPAAVVAPLDAHLRTRRPRE